MATSAVVHVSPLGKEVLSSLTDYFEFRQGLIQLAPPVPTELDIKVVNAGRILSYRRDLKLILRCLVNRYQVNGFPGVDQVILDCLLISDLFTVELHDLYAAVIHWRRGDYGGSYSGVGFLRRCHVLAEMGLITGVKITGRGNGIMWSRIS